MMKYEIIFSESARNDLISIVTYISEELLEPNIAEKISERILKAIRTLDEFPMRHKLWEHKVWKEHGLRALPVENYLVFYITDEINTVVKIYRIIYGKRDMNKEL